MKILKTLALSAAAATSAAFSQAMAAGDRPFLVPFRQSRQSDVGSGESSKQRIRISRSKRKTFHGTAITAISRRS